MAAAKSAATPTQLRQKTCAQTTTMPRRRLPICPPAARCSARSSRLTSGRATLKVETLYAASHVVVVIIPCLNYITHARGYRLQSQLYNFDFAPVVFTHFLLPSNQLCAVRAASTCVALCTPSSRTSSPARAAVHRPVPAFLLHNRPFRLRLCKMRQSRLQRAATARQRLYPTEFRLLFERATGRKVRPSRHLCFHAV